MLQGDERIVKHTIGLLNVAEELSNVSRACKIMSLFRDTFYRYKNAVDNGGIESLIDKSRRKPIIKNRVEELVIPPKNYSTKTPITATDLFNDRVLPFFEMHQLPLLRILTDRGTEYCGKAETHDYQLYLAINDIEHTKTKVRSPQTNGICERLHNTVL